MSLIAGALCLTVPAAGALAACAGIDFLTAEVAPVAADPHPGVTALRLAYPDLVFPADGTVVSAGGAAEVALGTIRAGVSDRERLAAPTVLEQFTHVYPLAFDLADRQAPFRDPGRLRNDAFFRMLWFPTEAAARASLTTVRFEGLSAGAVQVTRHRGVDCQLRAALDEVRRSGVDAARFFEAPGGGFNWRTIGGTSRLSAHSFGIAVDINPALGGYWRWAGAREGAVGAYRTEIQEAIVAAFERYGFIWGGKWHHYDGMHFEYRPELIIYSRLLSGGASQ